MVGSDGGVFAFGDAGYLGSLPALHVHVNNIVGVVPTHDNGGYWMVGSDGGVFAFGDAGYLGSLPALLVHVRNIVGVVPTHDNGGYWMVGSDGGVFAFGDAGYLGSLPALHVHVNNIVGVVPTSNNGGYWMVGSDGGVFAFGDAPYLGSLPGISSCRATFCASGNGSDSDVITAAFTVPNNWYLDVSYNCNAFGFADGPLVDVELPDGSFTEDPGVDMSADSRLVDNSGETFQPTGGTFRLEIITGCSWSLTARP
jgi:hypothetical protein